MCYAVESVKIRWAVADVELVIVDQIQGLQI